MVTSFMYELCYQYEVFTRCINIYPNPDIYPNRAKAQKITQKAHNVPKAVTGKTIPELLFMQSTYEKSQKNVRCIAQTKHLRIDTLRLDNNAVTSTHVKKMVHTPLVLRTSMCLEKFVNDSEKGEIGIQVNLKHKNYMMNRRN